MHQELKAQGIHCGRKRVERLMREDGLRAKRGRRFQLTTNSARAYPIAPNLLERRFTAEEVGGLDRIWVGDITYVPTRQGWLYLAVVLDLASRRVVGWAMKDTLEASLAADALAIAFTRGQPAAACCTILIEAFSTPPESTGRFWQLHGITCNMSRKGNCWDNAVAESFYATLERELIEENDWHTHVDAKRSIFEYLEMWYNRRRRHSALGYKSPVEYEEELAFTPKAA